MLETLVPMKIPAFAAHLTDVEITYSDKKYYELCAKWASEMSFGHRKPQFIQLVEAILRPFWDYDELEYKKPNYPRPSSNGREFGGESEGIAPLLLKEGAGVVKQANIKHFYFAMEAL